MFDGHDSFLDSNESQEIALIDITMNYLLCTLTQSLAVIIILYVLFGAKRLLFDALHVYFQFQMTIAARFDYLSIINRVTTFICVMNNHDKILGDMLTKTDESMDRRAREQLKNGHDILENNITKGMECFRLIFIESLLVAATSVTSVISRVEVMIQPLLEQFIQNHAVYGDSSEEILDLIDLFIECGDLPGVFIWNMCDKIMNLQDVNPAINDSRIINIASQYINPSGKFEVSLNNFMINGITTKLMQYESK